MSEARRDLPVGSSVILSALIVVGAAVALDHPEAPAPALAVGGGPPSPPPESAPKPSSGREPEPGPESVPDPGPVPERPRSAFSTSQSGETLRDVAHRVYGTEDALATLLGANRDIIRDPDAPLTNGTFLRTP